MGHRTEGMWGLREGWAGPFRDSGKGKVWKWRGLSDGFQSHLPLPFPHFVPEIN